jgi:uncharacterized protein YihD (DUF1040 family)
MRDPKRIDEMLDEIREIWKRSPDLRLMQLLLNCFSYDCPNGRVYNTEDEVLLEKIKEVYNKPD